MRLLHCKRLELEEFLGERIPAYAILSHTWGDGEVSYQDMKSAGSVASKSRAAHSRIARLPGYGKIKQCCSQAAAEGYEWVWIDTCCIDKSSSAELTEAINSMYQWYADAAVCYAFLSDVDVAEEWEWDESQFRSARWFTRGWTLQELIAPRSVTFYGKGWREIGTKLSLESLVSDITGVDAAVLRGSPPSSVSVAHRMSWAASRMTTRQEDLAYCLLGLFQVNMPLLYGEGERAFERLQKEIIQREDDFSILTWSRQARHGSAIAALAQSPKDFQDPFNIFHEQLGVRGASSVRHTDLNFMSPSTLEQSIHDTLAIDVHMAINVQMARSASRRLLPLNFMSSLQKMPPGVLGPPFVTSRGLRITLYVREHQNLRGHLLAWTFGHVASKLVCLVLCPEANRDGITGTIWRRAEPLYYIPSDEAEFFRPQQLYLSIRGAADDQTSSGPFHDVASAPIVSLSGFKENGYKICFGWQDAHSYFQESVPNILNRSATSDTEWAKLVDFIVNKFKPSRHFPHQRLVTVLHVSKSASSTNNPAPFVLFLGYTDRRLGCIVQDAATLDEPSGHDRPTPLHHLFWFDFKSPCLVLRSITGFTSFAGLVKSKTPWGLTPCQPEASETKSLRRALALWDNGAANSGSVRDLSDRALYHLENGDRLSVSIKLKPVTIDSKTKKQMYAFVAEARMESAPSMHAMDETN